MKANKRPATFMIVSVAFALTLTIGLCAFCGKDAAYTEATGAPKAENTPTETGGKPETTEQLKLVSIVPITEPETTQEPQWQPDEQDIEYIAKTLYGECRGVESTTEKAAVAWCILNRVDTTGYACGRSIEYVVTFKNQFQGYDPNHPVTPELQSLAEDVLIRHHNELAGEANVGRILPKEYIYFIGDTKRNFFTTEFLGKNYWDWSLESPYES